MRYILILLFILISQLSFAQSTDKLVELLKETPNDSTRMIKLLNDQLQLAVALEYNDSIEYVKFGDIGIIFYSKNFPEYALDYFVLAKKAASKMGDDTKYAQMLMNIGVIYEILGDYKTSLENYQESLETFIEIDDLRSQSLVYNNIAIMHQELGNVDQTYHNLIKSYNLKKQINDSVLIASTLNNLGVFYEEMKQDIDSAIYFYFNAKELYKNLGDHKNMAICQNNIGQALFNDKDYENAKIHFDLASQVFTELDDRVYLSRALLYYGKTELALGNFSKSVDLLERALALLDASSFVRNKMDIYQQLGKAYYEVGLYQNSSESYEIYLHLKDSLLNIDKQNEISKLELKFQTSQKEFEIRQLQQDKEIQAQKLSQIKLWIVAGVIFLFSVILILYMNGRHKKLYIQNKNTQIKQSLLQNQMNPHFLFNVLTSIQTYLSKSDTENASAYLNKFARLTRVVLQSSAQDKILLSEELDLLRNYISLEKLRLNDSFDYQIIIDDNVEIDEINIPPMMVQVFVENAIKHGLTGVDKGSLIIEVAEQSGYIVFTITDNGKGMMHSSQVNNSNQHKSMATKIIMERAELLKQKWKKDVKITYQNVEKGTKLDIVLPEI